MIYVLKIYMGSYYHWALETDRTFNGKPTLISNSWRNGTVAEEPWEAVVGNRRYQRLAFKTNEHPQTVLMKARLAIGKVKYRLLSYNCEHFVRELVCGIAESKQVQNAAIAAAIFGVIWAMSRKR